MFIPCACGTAHLPGDYLCGNQRGSCRQAGLWGVFYGDQPGKRQMGCRR